MDSYLRISAVTVHVDSRRETSFIPNGLWYHRLSHLASDLGYSPRVESGAVIVTSNGERVGEGRNRAYDPAGGTDRLQRTPIAHAEMNALAAIGTGTELGDLTLRSSHQPCLTCAAACEFTGVGRVAFVAPDPSAAIEATARERRERLA